MCVLLCMQQQQQQQQQRFLDPVDAIQILKPEEERTLL